MQLRLPQVPDHPADTAKERTVKGTLSGALLAWLRLYLSKKCCAALGSTGETSEAAAINLLEKAILAAGRA